jgi:hypothetical protein
MEKMGNHTICSFPIFRNFMGLIPTKSWFILSGKHFLFQDFGDMIPKIVQLDITRYRLQGKRRE